MEDRGHRRLRRPLHLLSVAALVAVGCGGGEADGPRVQGEPPAAPAPVRTVDEPEPVTWTPSRALLADLGRVAGGEAGAALASAGGGPVAVAGPLRAERAWSTIKVPLLVAFLAHVRRERGTASGAEGLTAGERADATAMITESANEPANRLFLALGGGGAGTGAVEQVLRRGGDRHTQVVARPPDGVRTFTWLGQTRWALRDGVGFHRALARGDVAPAPDTRFVVGLMRRVTGSEWGLRTALPPSLPLAYKVGLGTSPDGTFVAEQYGITGRGAAACVIGLVARDETETAAKATVTRLAQAARAQLRTGCPA